MFACFWSWNFFGFFNFFFKIEINLFPIKQITRLTDEQKCERNSFRKKILIWTSFVHLSSFICTTIDLSVLNCTSLDLSIVWWVPNINCPLFDLSIYICPFRIVHFSIFPVFMCPSFYLSISNRLLFSLSSFHVYIIQLVYYLMCLSHEFKLLLLYLPILTQTEPNLLFFDSLLSNQLNCIVYTEH